MTRGSTAAETAGLLGQIACARPEGESPWLDLTRRLAVSWRNDAHSEGGRYALAIRGARAMRTRAATNPPVPFLDMAGAAADEKRRGIPIEWAAR